MTATVTTVNKIKVELKLPLGMVAQLSSKYLYHARLANPNHILEGKDRKISTSDDDLKTPVTLTVVYIDSRYYLDFWGLMLGIFANTQHVYMLMLSEYLHLPLTEIHAVSWDDETFDTTYGTFSFTTFYSSDVIHTFEVNSSKIYLKEW